MKSRQASDKIAHALTTLLPYTSLEWQAPLYAVFVDFQKAFDIVDRDVIWRLMHHYVFPPKFISIIQQLYKDATCQVIHEGKLTEPFNVQTGVHHGCLLSPTIFLMVVDWSHEAVHSRTKEGHSMDRHEAAGGSGLRRRHQPFLPRRTGEATSWGRRSPEDWTPDQHREDRGHTH